MLFKKLVATCCWIWCWVLFLSAGGCAADVAGVDDAPDAPQYMAAGGGALVTGGGAGGGALVDLNAGADAGAVIAPPPARDTAGTSAAAGAGGSMSTAGTGAVTAGAGSVPMPAAGAGGSVSIPAAGAGGGAAGAAADPAADLAAVTSFWCVADGHPGVSCTAADHDLYHSQVSWQVAGTMSFVNCGEYVNPSGALKPTAGAPACVRGAVCQVVGSTSAGGVDTWSGTCVSKK